MHRRTLLKAGVATTAGGLLPLSEALTVAASAVPQVDQVLARNLIVPWGVAFLPSGNALVGERDSGNVFRVKKDGGKRLIGTVPGVVSRPADNGEGGLLGLAFSPNFAIDNWLYAYMSTTSDNRIVRMKYADGTLGAPSVVLPGIPTAVHHNGGGLTFGPDGNLYASTGDAERSRRAQNKASLGGKILRMTPRGRAPHDNPFGNYVWSYGHRNVQGIVFDPQGRLWASELGEHTFDEMNRIHKGGDYGWPRVEGRDGPGGYRDPIAVWRPENCSPSGIAVAGGQAFIGALRGQSLWSVRLDGPLRGSRVRHFHTDFGRIRGVQKAPDGSLWITTSNLDNRPTTPHPNNDRVIRITV